MASDKNSEVYRCSLMLMLECPRYFITSVDLFLFTFPNPRSFVRTHSGEQFNSELTNRSDMGIRYWRHVLAFVSGSKGINTRWWWLVFLDLITGTNFIFSKRERASQRASSLILCRTIHLHFACSIQCSLKQINPYLHNIYLLCLPSFESTLHKEQIYICEIIIQSTICVS